MKILLHHRILLGYSLLMMVVLSMVTLLLFERNRATEIEGEVISIQYIQREINEAHRHVTQLATLAESVIAWDDADYNQYHKCRLKTDSLLVLLQSSCSAFVRPGQIDTLRSLMASKEEYLYGIMQTIRKQNVADSILINHLPALANHPTKTVIRKKKGIAGLFGKKETVQVPSGTSSLQALNRKLVSMVEEREKALGIYTDSLRNYNKELNRKLSTLIADLDTQTEKSFQNKEQQLKISYERSMMTITILITSAILLLIISYLRIHRDIKEREKTKKRLEDTIMQNSVLLEMRKNIILTISHDIRAPLNIISGSAELAMDTKDKKKRNIHLNNINIVCRHVVHLLNNLLDVYRLNEAKETRNEVPFNLNELLERTASGFSRLVNNKGIRFDCDFRDTEVKLNGDVDRISQIIDNLLTNAVKFTEVGIINFSVSYHKGQLSLEVKDTGIGMSEDTLSRIFRPFERQVSAANVDGFGLGLAITQGLINLLNGTIKVTSSVGHGSTFCVTLPLVETDAPVENENPILPNLTHLPQNVIVIDDDMMLRDVVKEMLERNGVTCTTCASVKEVVKEMRNRDYDVLLSDIQMPGTNGFDLLTLLRNSNIGNSRTIPVIAMTARGDRDKETFLDAGFTDCIYKPFSSSELLSLLSTVKGKPAKKTEGFDFGALLSEVSDKVKLLRSVIDQSTKDRDDLGTAMKKSDRARLREIAHRMQPLWELLQAGEGLSAYRALLKNGQTGDDILKNHTLEIMDCTSLMIKKAENEIKRLTHETKDTDS